MAKKEPDSTTMFFDTTIDRSRTMSRLKGRSIAEYFRSRYGVPSTADPYRL
jgi:hypothetical protein